MSMGSFDRILDKIGSQGRFQLRHLAICGFCTALVGLQTVLNVFLQATPDFRCRASHNGSWPEQNDTTPSGESNEGKCVQGFANPTNGSTAICNEWKYDYSLFGTTAVTKWNLVCDQKTYPAIAQSLYMIGFFIGAFLFGHLSDKFGRKISFHAAALGVFVFAVASAFMHNYWAHVILRMFVGICGSGINSISFSIVTETIAVERRALVGIITSNSFAVGYAIFLPALAMIKDFVWTNFTAAMLFVLTIPFYWILSESPRWLIAKNRVDEAKTILKKAAKINGRSVDVDQLVEEHIRLEEKVTKTDDSAVPNYSVLDLVRTPNMRFNIIIVCYFWCVCGLTFYGLTMGVASLTGNPYLNLFISGLSEFASGVVLFLMLSRIGRRPTLMGWFLVGGISCIICGLTSKDHELVTLVFSMIGKFGISGAFTMQYLITSELFPTVLRTTAVSTGSMSARIGSLSAPFVGELRHVWTPLPVLIFGGCSLVAALLSFLLPETLGQKLPDTLEESEMFSGRTGFSKCRSSKRTTSLSAKL